jgi:hypothetical protein
MSWPGPNGAEPNMRFEAFCEGLAEADALLVISEGLGNHRATLGEKLAADCETLLRDRLVFNWARIMQAGGHYHMNHFGWLELNERTFNVAAKVAEATR